MPICDSLCVRQATGHGQEGVVVMEPFRIHVADEVLDDLRARLRHTRWPDQVPGIGWQQGTELDWLRRRVSYWAQECDRCAWRGGPQPPQHSESGRPAGRSFGSRVSVPASQGNPWAQAGAWG